MTVVVIPFLYVGTLISKNFAALLEEHDIFVPEDDDDDDWAIFIKIYGCIPATARKMKKMVHIEFQIHYLHPSSPSSAIYFVFSKFAF